MNKRSFSFALVVLGIAGCGTGPVKPEGLYLDPQQIREDIGGEYLMTRSYPAPLRVFDSLFTEYGDWNVMEGGPGLYRKIRRYDRETEELIHVEYTNVEEGDTSPNAGAMSIGFLVRDRGTETLIYVYENPYYRYGNIDHIVGWATYDGYATGIYAQGDEAGQYRASFEMTADFDANTLKARLYDYENNDSESLGWETIFESDDLRTKTTDSVDSDWVMGFVGYPGYNDEFDPAAVSGEYRDRFEDGSVIGVFYGLQSERVKPENE